MSSDSNKRCFQELKAEGTSNISHDVAKGLSIGPCHVLCQFLDTMAWGLMSPVAEKQSKANVPFSIWKTLWYQFSDKMVR